MTTTDPVESSLRAALSQRLEIDFKIGGAPVTMRPHVLYHAANGTLTIAGMTGDILTRVPVGQINNLLISPRYFQPDPAFDRSNPEYNNAVAKVTGI